MKISPFLLAPVIGASSLLAQTPPVPGPPPPPVPIVLAPWEKIVSLPAEAAPYYRATLGTPATGWVASVKADAGSRMKKGDLLAEIDAPELIAASAARGAEARAAEQKIVQATAMLSSAEAEAKAAESEYARMSELSGTGTVTKKVGDEAEARFESAKAKVGEAKAGVAAAEAESLAAAARATEAAATLAYTRIIAPYDGLVVERHAELGDFLGSASAGAKLFVYEQTDPLRVRIYLPEHAATLTKAGQAVTLRIAGQEFTAELARVSGSLDPVTRTVTGEVDLTGTGLLPGSYGTATMKLARLESAALVPQVAVRTGADGSRFVVIVEGESQKNVPVTLYTTEGAKAVITGDLVAGMMVLLP